MATAEAANSGDGVRWLRATAAECGGGGGDGVGGGGGVEAAGDGGAVAAVRLATAAAGCLCLCCVCALSEGERWCWGGRGKVICLPSASNLVLVKDFFFKKNILSLPSVARSDTRQKLMFVECLP